MVAHLRAAEVCDAEHEFEDTVAAADDGRIRDGDGAPPVLGVADARKDYANDYGVHQ